MSSGEVARQIHGAGRRPTPQRVLVAEALAAAGRTVTASELYDELRRDNPFLGRATVFRTLDVLVAEGLAQRFQQGAVSTYTTCQPEHHHHHLVCSRCRRSVEIADDEVAPLIASMKTHYGFELAHASLDFTGTCARCLGTA